MIKLYARHSLSSPYIADKVVLAKDGNVKAIQQILEEFTPKGYLEKVKKGLGDTSNIVYIPIMEKGYDKNILPLVLACRLSEYINGEVCDCLRYKPSLKRKELNRWERMVVHREYEVGDIEYLKNKRVVLVDDMFTTGGSIRDAYLSLDKRGVKIDSIICLGASRERDFLPSKEDIKKFTERFTENEVFSIENLTGVEIKYLTSSEIKLILQTGGNNNVIKKLEGAKASVVSYERGEVDTRGIRETQADSERSKRDSEESLPESKSSVEYIRNGGKEKTVKAEIQQQENKIEERRVMFNIDEEDKRTILKFDDKGIPYIEILNNVPGVKTIIKGLQERIGDERPIIIAGDLSGLGEFNNKYGREIADGAIEKALELFVNEFSNTGAVVGSPSGDEMWGVLPKDAKVEKVIEQLTEVLKKLNNINYKAIDDVVGLNAKFYISRKQFADVEKHLKYDSKTGEKLQPGVIIVEGSLLNSKEDVIIKPQDVSNEIIIWNTEKADVRENLEEERGNNGTRHKKRIDIQRNHECEKIQTIDNIRELTSEEKETFEKIQKEIKTISAIKLRQEILGSIIGGEPTKNIKKIMDGKIRVNIRDDKELRIINQEWKKSFEPGRLFDKDGLLNPISEIKKLKDIKSETKIKIPKEIEKTECFAQEHKIIINNKYVLESVKGVDWKYKQIKEKMEQTEIFLNETKTISPEQKIEVGKILNSESAKSIWNKYSLNSKDCIVAARYLSDKETNKEGILKNVPEMQQKIIKNIEKGKNVSAELEM